ncbi:MAG: hypothetical protein OXQ89_22670 [Rhodospirillaceae bacterium]|nr:hypothetical protein [Rhodospirillaceae bacterium]MDE0000557.1 hypothetical protein [Rhodospirillaceae bacterium]
MSKHTRRREPASTYLVHHFGRGPVDEGRTYAVERFRAMSDGTLQRWPLEVPTGNGGNRPRPELATFGQLREIRPAYNEVIVCTALGTRSGIQFWGYYAALGLFPDRRRRR